MPNNNMMAVYEAIYEAILAATGMHCNVDMMKVFFDELERQGYIVVEQEVESWR